MLVRGTSTSFIVVVALAFVGCGAEESISPLPSEPPSLEVSTPAAVGWIPVPATYPPVGIPRKENLSQTDWAYHHANSVKDMVARYSTVIVGEGVSVDVGYPWAQFLIEHFGRDEVQSPQPGDPKAGLPTVDPSGPVGPLASTYQIQVLEVIKSETLKPGDMVTLRQFGGVADGVLEQALEDPVLKLGPSYLLFIDPTGDGTFSSPPFGRFEIDQNGRLQSIYPDFWNQFPAVAALSGQTIDAATSAIQAEIASAQTPGGAVSTAAP